MATTTDSPPTLTPESGGTDGVALARQLAEEFRPHVVERERAAAPPYEELQRVRETGLVNFHIPVELGGGGGTWQQVARVIFELSRVDPNIGALLAYHYHNFLPPYWDPQGDAADLQRTSAERRWLWGHVTAGPLLQATPQADGGFVVNGSKPQNTGAGTGDVVTVAAARTDRNELVYFVLPVDREGITRHPAWDLTGFRRTETQAIDFDHVRVHPDEVQRNTTGQPHIAFPPFYGATGWLAFGAIYVGAAWGALETAREYVLTRQHAPHGSDSAAADPFVQARFGELWIKAEAVLAFQDRAATLLDEVREERRSLSPDRLAETTAAATAFRVRAGRTALAVGNGVYDVLGGGATARSVGLDRYWRDVRAHSLHAHTYVYDNTGLGNHVLNGEPDISPRFFG